MFGSRCLRTSIVAAALATFAHSAQSQDASLPDGKGKELVASVCTACHGTRQIERSSGYDQAGWRALAATMVDLSDSPDDWQTITSYLARHFPPNQRRAPTLVEGAVEIVFEEWVTPTLGQRSRDPVEAPDGSIWWAGQWGNLVGRIDPATGEMEEFPLPESAMPHSVNVDPNGKDIWYTGNKNGTMGRLDPETHEITEFAMPDPAARDPHTAEFDEDGILWFTLQQSNKIGRLDPASGDIKLVDMPTAGSRPYGIKIDSEGAPWVACNGGNCLVKVDPKTMVLSEVKLPIPETTVRRLDIDDDGIIWYVNSRQGRLGRYDPSSGEIKEWPSPSGPKSHPYALAVVDGIVWYNESGMRPDVLVRFDPKTEIFQAWPIPSGDVYAGIIRHMRPDADGNLLIHQSSTNRIMRVIVNETRATQ